jgi:hypothetical protein
VCFYGGRLRASIGLLEAPWKRSTIAKSLSVHPNLPSASPRYCACTKALYPTQFEANFPFISIALLPSCLRSHHTHTRIIAFSSITSSSPPHVCGYFLACGRDAPSSSLLPNVDPVTCHRTTLRSEHDLPLGHAHAVISSHPIRREAHSFTKRNCPSAASKQPPSALHRPSTDLYRSWLPTPLIIFDAQSRTRVQKVNQKSFVVSQRS